MSKRTMGIFLSLVGSGLGAWWVMSRGTTRAAAPGRGRDRGRVIYDNTPTAAEGDVAP